MSVFKSFRNTRASGNDIELVSFSSSINLDDDVEGDISFSTKSRRPYVHAVAFMVLAGFLIGSMVYLMNSVKGAPIFRQPVPEVETEEVMFDRLGRYVMHNYDKKKPMSNFLSGLAGLWGVPMWTFYVNRGQAITSFGVQNKDGMIEKFQSAEKAYQLTPFTGFRTFVKGSRSNGITFEHMPFFPRAQSCDAEAAASYTRNMMVDKNEVEIEEIAPSIGLQTNVLYFNLPDEDFPSLVRRTTFTNLDTTSVLTVDVLDGLDKLIPSGLSNTYVDSMGRLAEAYMNVYNVGDRTNIREPFFHISQGTADTADVQVIKEGHFTVAFVESDHIATQGGGGGASHQPLPFIVDPDLVFGFDTSQTDPSGFFGVGSLDAWGVSSQPQVTTSRTPCSFAAAKLVIAPGASVTVTSIYGHAENLETFVGKYSPKIRAVGYVEKARTRSRQLVDEMTAKVKTSTSSSLFNAYVEQSYLDNSLRGGLPVIFGDDNTKVYHTFNRVHGDIERDYNWFQLEPTYFSQGPGNFRDVNQNRRNDVLINPLVGDFDIRMFLSFIGSDGYNPLTVATTNLKVPTIAAEALVSRVGIVEPTISEGSVFDPMLTKAKALVGLLTKPFRIGQLFRDMKNAGIVFSIDRDEFLKLVVNSSQQAFAAAFMQNGYWSDHWTYTLDLVENYLAIFPDHEETLLWDGEKVGFYLCPAVVRPRSVRYKLVASTTKSGSYDVRSYGAVSTWGEKDFPATKVKEFLSIKADPNYMGNPQGEGWLAQRSETGVEVKVTAAAKLFMLAVLKFSTLDPYGMGVEMEGGKPGWNDAMNGLPGILGSSMAETYEMLRVVRYVKSAVSRYTRPITIPEEFATLLSTLTSALATYDGSAKENTDDFVYWDASNTARELYRANTNTTFTGVMTELSAEDIVSALTTMEQKTLGGIVRSLSTGDSVVSPTYFSYDCTDYMTSPGTDGNTVSVHCKAFQVKTLPLFLEGPVRHLKIAAGQSRKRDILHAVKASNLYDAKLKMFTLSESLDEMGPEVGRMKAFSAGWLENQSVFLHMSYKFYLELLRAGLYTEFFEEMKTGLVPFMDNTVYGRSPLEAASFLVSSAFPDPKLHGASFMPRLSGSTAEFLSMWSIMMAGIKPFSLDSETNELQLRLAPSLPGTFFNEDGTAGFTFLGGVEVVYHNPSRVDSWTLTPRSAVVMYRDGRIEQSIDGIIRGDIAKDVRDLKAATINIYLSQG